MIDKIDMDIIKILEENSKLQYKAIGEMVHLSGQAVSNRVSKLESLGVIKGYTIVVDNEKTGECVEAMITVFMKSNDHFSFQSFIKKKQLVKEAHRISGDGCYALKVLTDSQDKLNLFLDELLKYANYRLQLSIGKIK
jgi:Lrp/AsnC family transcriptional regulator, leucine-responsive regulatory protein